MVPIIEVTNKDLKAFNQLGIKYNLRDDLETKTSFDKDNFIYVPSIGLYVAKEKILSGKNWFQAHEGLQSQGERMLTLPEFIEFLKYTKINFPEIYSDITKRRLGASPIEWLDADFKVKNGKLYINSNHKLEYRKLIPQNSEVLDKNILMKDKKTLGIDLESWLNNPTKQGLPSKKTKPGDLCYWHPKKNIIRYSWSPKNYNQVVMFATISGAFKDGLFCDADPSANYIGIRVRAAKQGI